MFWGKVSLWVGIFQIFLVSFLLTLCGGDRVGNESMILNQAGVLPLSGRNLAIQLFKCVMVVVVILLDLNHLHTDQEKNDGFLQEKEFQRD